MGSDNCDKTQESLYEYEDGTLDDTIHNEIEKHLKECQDCREFRATLKILRNVTPSKLSEDFTERVMETITFEEREVGDKHSNVVKIAFWKRNSIELPETPNPVIVMTENIEERFIQLEKQIIQHGGKIVSVTEYGLEQELKWCVPVYIPEAKQPIFLGELQETGEARLAKEGYKDRDGNIVVILKSSN